MLISFEPSIGHVRRLMNRGGSQLSVRPHTPDEAVAYARPQAADFITPQRERWRALMQENGAAWRGLSDTQRENWNSYAATNQRQLEMLRKKPSAEPFTGYRLFTMLYCQRRKLEMEPLLEPPHQSPQTGAVEVSLVRVTEEGTVEVKAQHPQEMPPGNGEPTHLLQVAMTPPTIRRSRRPQRKHVVHVRTELGQGLMKLPQPGNTLKLRSGSLSPAPGQRFGVLARIIRCVDGMPGPWTWFDTNSPKK